jgi:hypothetical protein
MSVVEARNYFVCKTHLTSSSGHGTQISYMRPNGVVSLWYPGNAVVLQGSWRIGETAGTPVASLCFRYGANTYNPVIKEQGGRWSCLPAHLWARVTVERADGDIFALGGRGDAPFKLSREATTIADLQKSVHSSDSKQRKVTPDRGCPATPR